MTVMAHRTRVVLGPLIAIAAGCDGSPATIDAANDVPGDAAAADATLDAPIDARVVDARPLCNPARPPGQSGCTNGARCTWVVTQDIPAPQGMLGCVPPGTVPLGDACTVGPPGPATGFDDCVEGAVCVGGTCGDVCSFAGGADGACSTGTTCALVPGLFGNTGEVPVAGVCRRGCDAIGQTECPPGQGCYVLVSALSSKTVCAAAGVLGQGQQISGQVFANSCRPGYMPCRRDSDSMVMECGALCRPADVTITSNQASEGGVAPDTCVARGAAPPADPVNGESCRYWWAREPTPGSPYSNTLGWCFRHAAFRYDGNGDGVLDTPHPRCVQVTTGDVLPPVEDPPVSDAEYFWCAALPSLFAREHDVAPAAPLALDRVTETPRADRR